MKWFDGTYSPSESRYEGNIDLVQSEFDRSQSARLLSTTALLLCGAGLGVLICRLWRSYTRLRQFRGPPLAGVSKLWLLKCVTSGKMNLIFYETAKQYGPVARIAPNSLLVSDADFWHRICAVRSPYTRADWYKGMRFEPGKDVILTYPDGKHLDMRAKMAAGYAGRDNEHFESQIDQRITALLNLIERKYISSTDRGYSPMDWGMIANSFTLDVISEVGFGHCIRNVEQDADCYDYYGAIMQGLPVVQVLTVLPWLVNILETGWISRLLTPSKDDKLGYGKLLGYARNRVLERFGPEKIVRKDMLGSFLNHGVTRKEMENEAIIQLMAGTDPAATAMRAATIYILTNPSAYNSLLAELKAHKLIPAPPITSVISNKRCQKLRYLQACVRETLRLHPPFCGLMEKTVPAGGDVTPDGRHIPEGTNVGFCFWGAMRDKTVFGDDADLFRPERWLEAKAEESRRMERSLECVFSVGRYTCLGRDVALLQVHKVLVELFRRFNFELVDPFNPWESFAYGIFLQRHLWLRVSRLVLTRDSQPWPHDSRRR